MELVEPITDPVKLEKMAEYLRQQSIRNYVIFEIGINLGIRVTDFTCQKVKFYKEACENGFVEMIPSKTSRYKKKIRVYMSDELKTLITEYIKDMKEDEWMFPSRKGGTPLTRYQIYRILNEAAEFVGITDNIGCHSMRKTFGYWHYKYNKDIRLLMEIFNHTSEAVTLRYIGVTNERKKESMAFMNLGIRKE